MQMLCSNFVQPTIACNTKKTLLVSGVCLRDMMKAATVSLSPVLAQVCIWLLSRLGLEFGGADLAGITKYGVLGWLDVQIVALRAHCT